MTRTLIASCLLLALSGCDRGPDVAPEFRDLDVPQEALRSPDRQAAGRALYEDHCILCHGPAGKGHGRRHTDLSSKPPDFTTPAWARTVTPRSVYSVIQSGKRGSSMPAFRVLDRDETWSLVAYVLSLSE